jgi:hypothetical protein
MADELTNNHGFRFGEFILDTRTRELARVLRGRRFPLRPRPLMRFIIWLSIAIGWWPKMSCCRLYGLGGW